MYMEYMRSRGGDTDSPFVDAVEHQRPRRIGRIEGGPVHREGHVAGAGAAVEGHGLDVGSCRRSAWLVRRVCCPTAARFTFGSYAIVFSCAAKQTTRHRLWFLAMVSDSLL